LRGTRRIYFHPAEVVLRQFLLEGAAYLLGHCLGQLDGQVVRQPPEEPDGVVPGVDLRGEAQVREPPSQDLTDLDGHDDVVLAGHVATVPVEFRGDLQGHPALLDAEEALPGQVRGQRGRGDFTFPGGPLALPIDLRFRDVVVLVAVVPHHVLQQRGRLLLREGRDRLGVVQVVEVAGDKLPGLVEAI
jgi:hypothetical protein